MFDKECHACYMKVHHLRHDKGRRRKKGSYYTQPVIYYDWGEVKIKNKDGVVKIRKRIL